MRPCATFSSIQALATFAAPAVVLSKALLLAADRKIQDPSITRQIGEGASSPPLR